MSKRALVIGGTGFLGTGIVQELLLAGWSVAALSRGRTAAAVGEVRQIVADRKHPGALAAALHDERFDVVVDCAAYDEPDAVDAVATLASRVEHYFFISTDFVYIARADLNYPLDEDAPKQVDHAYGLGKLACERVLTEAWRLQGFPATVLRPPHILGHGKALGCEFGQMRDMQLLEKLRSGQGLVLTAEGQLLVQPVWHREIGRAIVHMADQRVSFGQIFNMPGPQCVTTRMYYQTIADMLGVPLRFESISIEELRRLKPAIAPVARHRVYDSRRLTETTGYKPALKLRDALEETLEWMQGAGGA
jgi:nucleoside-diphosphate-sugar epimerase